MNYVVSRVKPKKYLEKHVLSEQESLLTCDVCGKEVLPSETLGYHVKKSNPKSSFVLSESMLNKFL